MSRDLVGVATNDIDASVELRSVSASLAALAQIGGGAEGGVTRVAASPELFDAYEWGR